MLAASNNARIEIEVNRSTKEWLDENENLIEKTPTKIILSHKSHELLSEAIKNDISISEFFKGERFKGVPVRNIAPCIAPANPVWNDKKVFDLNALGEDGKLEIFHFTKYYITDEYYTRSLRCQECLHSDKCRGMHINYVRNFGFKVMEPVNKS